MRSLEKVSLASFAVLLLAACTEGPVASPVGPVDASLSRTPASPAPTLLDVAEDAGTFSTFLAAVDASGLGQELTRVGQQTLFAPTDAAFGSRGLDPSNVADRVDADALREVLLHHAAKGRRDLLEVASTEQVRMADGTFVPVSATADGVLLDEARIVAPDLGAKNGILHGLDGVLVPGGVLFPPVQVDPPYWGTIFIDPDIITPDDPTAFQGIEATGRGWRWMFDRRVNGWIWVEPYLFDATYGDGLSIEVQVNPEFDAASALAEAEKYAREVGRLPTVLRKDVETMWIHQGVQPFGGGNNNILIHTGQAALYEADGILHETLVHESTHTSLDAEHRASAGWLDAQEKDGNFISVYARDYPGQEDLAETFLTWLAVRHAADRIPASMYRTILETIPYRIAYLDAQGFTMYPLD